MTIKAWFNDLFKTSAEWHAEQQAKSHALFVDSIGGEAEYAKQVEQLEQFVASAKAEGLFDDLVYDAPTPEEEHAHRVQQWRQRVASARTVRLMQSTIYDCDLPLPELPLLASMWRELKHDFSHVPAQMRADFKFQLRVAIAIPRALWAGLCAVHSVIQKMFDNRQAPIAHGVQIKAK